MVRIGIIGAGQLGSRHLQGLALIDRDTSVTVVDPSSRALATAQDRFDQIHNGLARPRVTSVSYLDSLDRLDGAFDLLIVATNADRRREVIERAVAYADVRNMILEKVLFQKVDDYAAVGRLLESRGIKAWVNCAQRLWPFFADLKPRLTSKRNVQILVTGSQWGLGCNAIHNADLIPFFYGDVPIRFESQLDPGSIESKRPGFCEFTGTLTCSAVGQCTVSQTSWRDGDAPLTFEIFTDDLHQIWRVTDGLVHSSDAGAGWGWQERAMHPPYQSQITHTVAQEILDRGTCVLPGYAESARLHIDLLEVFLCHLAKFGAVSSNRCPIT